MISVASIKSEIYELSSNEVFQSAVEEFGDKTEGKGQGDNSIGVNTYTIFPPENANRLSGVKSTDLSDGRNTVVSDDFTDAEDIEEFETAPIDELSDDVIAEPEKADDEKVITADLPKSSTTLIEKNASSNLQSAKPCLEVHPMVESSKFNTFVVKKSPMSPRSSPRQKRRDDPDRYRTHTINPINMGKAFVHDANGNPDLKFATFRVGGPKVIKPMSSQNMNVDSDSSNSPASTPGHSPRGIRGRRKPLYSSLPPSAIVRKQQKTAPPPVPPKPARTSSSPARSTTSLSAGGGVYVRPTRTTELRNAANNSSRDPSRDSSPRRIETMSSRNSSNSSLNLIHGSSRMSDCGASVSSGRPKVAPKPPVRTTPSITAGNTFSGSASNVPIHIKASNSSFGFGQQTKIGDFNDSINMKGYSTLPKSSKFRSETPFSMDRYCAGESKESIPGSEKSGKSGIGKISNLWKKMDFRSHKEPASAPKNNANPSDNKSKSQHSSSEKDKKATQQAKSKIQNFFGRGKKEKPAATSGIPTTIQKPFREPLPIHSDPACHIVFADTAPASTSSIRVRRDGDNKVIVPPFNYTPPDRSNSVNSNNENSKGTTVDEMNPSAAPHGVRSSKITTV